MLAVNSFVKATPSRRGNSQSPPPGAFGASPSAGPTSPTGSAMRRGRLHVPTRQPTPEAQTRERKAAAAAAAAQHANNNSNNDDDAYSSGGNSSDDGSDSSPVERPRRRFVKPTVTTFETCFSRHALGGGGGGGGRRFNRRPGAGPRVGLASYSFINSNSSAALALASATASSDTTTATTATTTSDVALEVMPGVRRAPAVSSLSSVLQELMHGRQRALSSYIDATVPQRNPRTFVVTQAPAGELFVASTIGARPAVLPSAVDGATSRPETTATALVLLPDAAGSMHRSDLDVSRVQRKPSAVLQRSLSRRDSMEAELSGSGGTGASSSSRRNKSKAKLLGFSSLKAKLAARRGSISIARSSGDRPMTLDEMDNDVDDDDVPAMLCSSNSSDSVRIAVRATGDSETAVPMLDPDLVDARARGDSSWAVPNATLSSAPAAVDKSKIVNRPIPFATAVNDDDDDDDDDDSENLLNRSFLNVRDIEFHPRTHKDDDPPVSVPAAALERTSDEDDDVNDCDNVDNVDDSVDADDDCRAQRSLLDRATFDGAANRPSATTSYDAYANRGASFSAGGATAGGRASVTEFLGGYKGQLSSRRSTSGPDGTGFVHRARSVRNGARRSAAANAAATALTRKLREARNRIPFEFRDDLTPVGKAKGSSNNNRKSKKLRVRWDLAPYVREFEVESEDEAEAEAAAAAQIVKAPWEYRDGEAHESDDDDDDDDDDDAQW